MSVVAVETLIVGGGQAGLAMSEHLSKRGVPHLIVERHRIAERWRSERWDSLVANGPAWHDRFPGMTFSGIDPDSFATKDQIVDYFVAYAERIAAPIRCGVEVTALTRRPMAPVSARRRRRASSRPAMSSSPPDRFNARSSLRSFPPIQESHRSIPPLIAIPASYARARFWSSAPARRVCRSRTSSLRAGRRVYLSVGPHNRPPRRYRGRDFVWWLGVLGEWDAKVVAPGTEHVTIAVSGAHGGHTVDFRDLAARGITLLGSAGTYKDGVIAVPTRSRQEHCSGRRQLPIDVECGRRLCHAEGP